MHPHLVTTSLSLALLASANQLPGLHQSPRQPLNIHGGHKLATQAACLDTSLHSFAWTVELEYHAFWYFTTPAHQNSWGTVAFNLTNPAVRTILQCRADSNRLPDFFAGEQTYNCSLPSAEPAVLPFTLFRFASRSRLDVNQSWACDDLDSGSPVSFAAVGTTQLNLPCTDATWENPNWTLGNGEFYSTRDVRCSAIVFDIHPYEEKLVLKTANTPQVLA